MSMRASHEDIVRTAAGMSYERRVWDHPVQATPGVHAWPMHVAYDACVAVVGSSRADASTMPSSHAPQVAIGASAPRVPRAARGQPTVSLRGYAADTSIAETWVGCEIRTAGGVCECV